MDDIYKNSEEYDSNKKIKILTVFDYISADILCNKKLNPIGIKLLIRGRKPNISIVFITQSYHSLAKNIRLNSTHYLKCNLWKFQTDENFYKLHLIIHQIPTLKTLYLFIKIYWKNLYFFSYWCYSCIR